MVFRKYVILLLMSVVSINALPQSERKYIRQGNDAFNEKAYTQSEVNYRKAIEKAPNSYKAIFNMGDAIYKQSKYQEAAKQFSALTNRDLSDEELARAYHNLGNSLLKAENIKESIDAYKNALKHNPKDMETKHNLTYALRKLKQQQQQKQNQNKNQQKNQDQKNQDQKDKQQQEQNNQQQQRENEDKKQQNQQKKQNQNQNQQQPRKDRISKQDARRLLQALENDERELQKKLKKKEAQAASAKSGKNW